MLEIDPGRRLMVLATWVSSKASPFPSALCLFDLHLAQSYFLGTESTYPTEYQDGQVKQQVGGDSRAIIQCFSLVL